MQLKFLVLLIVSMMLANCQPNSTLRLDNANIQNSEHSFYVVLPKSVWEEKYPDLEGEINIFLSDQSGQNIQPIIAGFQGYNYIQDISYDDNKIVFASFKSVNTFDGFADLYVANLNGSEVIKITDQLQWENLFPLTKVAMWYEPQDSIFFIARNNKLSALYMATNGSANLVSVFDVYPAVVHKPFYLVGLTENDKIYWRDGKFDGSTLYLTTTLWETSLLTGETIEIKDLENGGEFSSVSPDGKKYVLENAIIFDLIEGTAVTLSNVLNPAESFWSPDSTKLFISATCDIEDCFEYYLWSSSDNGYIKIPFDKPILSVDWSPDSKYLLLHAYQEKGGSTEYLPYILDAQTLRYQSVLSNLDGGFYPFKFAYWGE